jgi:hypothetical protein
MVVLTSWNICTSFSKNQSLEVHYPSVQTFGHTCKHINPRLGTKTLVPANPSLSQKKKWKRGIWVTLFHLQDYNCTKMFYLSDSAIDNNMPCQLNLNHKRYARTKQSQSKDTTTWVVPCNTAWTKGLSISAAPICTLATLQAYTNLRTGFILLNDNGSQPLCCLYLFLYQSYSISI